MVKLLGPFEGYTEELDSQIEHEVEKKGDVILSYGAKY